MLLKRIVAVITGLQVQLRNCAKKNRVSSLEMILAPRLPADSVCLDTVMKVVPRHGLTLCELIYKAKQVRLASYVTSVQKYGREAPNDRSNLVGILPSSG